MNNPNGAMPMNTIEATMSVDACMEINFRFMRKEGFYHPTLILLKKGSAMVTAYEHDSLVNINCHAQDDDDPEKIYLTIAALRMRDSKDDRGHQEIANSLTAELDPDAVALTLSCYAKCATTSEIKELKDLSTDPDTFRVIESTLYLRDDDKPILRLVPYLHRGSAKSGPDTMSNREEHEDPQDTGILDLDECAGDTLEFGIRENGAMAGFHGMTGPYDITPVVTPWGRNPFNARPRLQNPYKA